MNERFGVGKDFKHMSLMKTQDGLILNLKMSSIVKAERMLLNT
jgi:hypothetical protein